MTNILTEELEKLGAKVWLQCPKSPNNECEENMFGQCYYCKRSMIESTKPQLTKEQWYSKQIEGLFLIIDDYGKDDKDFMITREYVKEKLMMILNGGINFHPKIKESVGLE